MFEGVYCGEGLSHAHQRNEVCDEIKKEEKENDNQKRRGGFLDIALIGEIVVYKIAWMRSPYKKNKNWSKCHLTTDGLLTMCGIIVVRKRDRRYLISDRTKARICKNCMKVFGEVK